MNGFDLTWYELWFVREASGGFSAGIREFDGCFAEGVSLQDAYENLQATANDWVACCIEDGIEIPPPDLFSSDEIDWKGTQS